MPGATSYQLFAQIGASTLGPIDVGTVTSVSIPNVPVGVYMLSVRGAAGAVTGPFSDPVTVVVGELTPPAAPSDLAAVINGVSASLSWNLNNPAGSLSSVRLRVAMTPGGTPIADLNLAASATSFFIPSAPPGSYYVTVVAVGAGGIAPSSEFTLTLPGCAAPPTIPLNASSIYSFIQFSWPLLPGSTGYTLELGNTPGGGPNLGAVTFPPTQTSYSHSGISDGTYYATLRSALTCGQAVSSAETVLTVAQPPQGPPLTKAQAHSVLTEGARTVAAQYPGELRNSCRQHQLAVQTAPASQADRYPLRDELQAWANRRPVAGRHPVQLRGRAQRPGDRPARVGMGRHLTALREQSDVVQR